MKLQIILFLLINGVVFSQEKIKTYSEKYLPKNIEDVINFMDYKWKEEDKTTFKNKPERIAVSELHFTYGMYIRNSWLRNGNPKLQEYFYRKKIFHLDDMSSIILLAFHRKLNNKKLGLNEIFKPYKIEWIEGKEGRKIYNDSINNVFASYKVRDTIFWKYYTTVVGINKEEIDKYGACKPKAVILKKNRKNTSFLIKLISCCNGKSIIVGLYGKNFSTQIIEINKTGWTSYWEWETK